MILSNRMSVRIADLYFDEPAPAGLRADIVRYNQFSRPFAGAAATSSPTMLLDLSQTPEEMLSKMKNHTRYKIRRAADKDNLSYEYSNGKDGKSITRFADHYDRYAALKGLGEVSRPRYEILAAQNALDLSFLCDGSGDILVASSYFVTPAQVRGLHLAAAFRGTSDGSRRSLIGRANRYLRWRDILRFREAGVKVLDFGGWYTGSGDAVRTNEFKAEFCGEVVERFSCQRAITWKGRLALVAMDWRQLLASKPAEASAISGDERDNEERPVSAEV
jgi:hypothetical protein